jgi:hypothetical protein
VGGVPFLEMSETLFCTIEMMMQIRWCARRCIASPICSTAYARVVSVTLRKQRSGTRAGERGGGHWDGEVRWSSSEREEVGPGLVSEEVGSGMVRFDPILVPGVVFFGGALRFERLDVLACSATACHMLSGQSWAPIAMVVVGDLGGVL